MLEYCDSFNTYSNGQLVRRYPSAADNTSTNTPGLGVGISSRPGGSGTCLVVHPWPSQGTWTVPLSPRNTYIAGMEFNVTVPGAAISFVTSAGAIGYIGFGSSGQIITPWGNSANGLYTFDTWAHIQILMTASPSAGAVVVQINNVTVFAAQNINTGSNPIISFQACGGYFITSHSTIYLANFFIFNTLGTHSNALPLGPVSIQIQTPVSDGTNHDWFQSSGIDHFSMVDEMPADDDTTYIYAQTPGLTDTLSISGITLPTTNRIHGTQVTAMYRKDDVDNKVVHVVGLSGSNLVESPDYTLNTTYQTGSLALPEDPATTAQWTPTGISNLQVGVKVIT